MKDSKTINKTPDKMNFDEVNDAIDLITTKTGVKEYQICEALGYTKAYISQMRDKGSFTPDFVKKLKHHYASVLRDEPVKVVPVEVEKLIVMMAAKQDVHAHYVGELFAKAHNRSVTAVLNEMQQSEREAIANLLKTFGLVDQK